jgi:hypothetical protein
MKFWVQPALLELPLPFPAFKFASSAAIIALLPPPPPFAGHLFRHLRDGEIIYTFTLYVPFCDW